MPTIHCDHHTANFIDLMREGCTNRIGRSAKSQAVHTWRKKKDNRKQTVMAYYRLIQAIWFLRDYEFVWECKELIDYAKPSGLINTGESIFKEYMSSKRNKPLTETEIIEASQELEALVGEVDRAMVATALPNQCPRRILDKILHQVEKTRLSCI